MFVATRWSHHAGKRQANLLHQLERAVVDANRGTQPLPLRRHRTITVRRRCRSIPTYCRPSYSSTGASFVVVDVNNPKRTTQLGDRHEERRPRSFIASIVTWGADGRRFRSSWCSCHLSTTSGSWLNTGASSRADAAIRYTPSGR
jgi:hypothetical protein